jgi:NCAIR mutase (PurE)-related protein
MSSNHRRPFDDIRAALFEPGEATTPGPGPSVRFDPGRASRTGVPEVIFAEHKTLEDVRAALARQAELTGRALASRCPPAALIALPTLFPEHFAVSIHPEARAVVVAHNGSIVEQTGGRIAVISAGTSDRSFAAEAALMAREMGVAVEEITDVGVAGLHRLVAPLERVMDAGVDAIVVAAGMDGALPSVIAGLVPVPVIGLPTSVGYGFGGQGAGALTAMLQSCAPGLMVVNIDNGIGAGSSAALIANRVALARAEATSVAVPQQRLDERPHRIS